ncbi:hypothetical protein BO70DRAFT_359371, partial [Aspergillus heteromorphus CBS 117.55]
MDDEPELPPPLPDRNLQLQLLLILCLSVYIITAIVLVLKSYCVAYGPFDFTLPSPAPSPSPIPTDQQPGTGTGARSSRSHHSIESRLKTLNRVAPLTPYGRWVRSAAAWNERSELLLNPGAGAGAGGGWCVRYASTPSISKTRSMPCRAVMFFMGGVSRVGSWSIIMRVRFVGGCFWWG